MKTKFFDFNGKEEILTSRYWDLDFPASSSKIEISELACRKLFYYVDATDIEISGLGSVQKISKNKYLVKDVYLLKQESSETNTVLSKEDIAKFLTSWITLGKDPSEIRLWWHSHGNGAVFWSGTDEDTCNSFNSDDFMVSLVVNKDHEFLGRIDKPAKFSEKEIIPTIKFDLDKELKRKCKQEVLTKNKRRKYHARKGLLKTSWPIQPFEITEFY